MKNKTILIIIAIILLFGFPALGIPVLLVIAGLMIYQAIYFKSAKFLAIKDSISDYIYDCNELNAHIEQLRSSYADVHKTDYGEATYTNTSQYKYKKSALANAKYAPTIYDCSMNVCDNARKQPFKYICKYFNIAENEESLNQFEEILNNFSAAEEGKELSKKKREEILNSISNDIPWIIKKFFDKTLDKQLGFDEFIFDEMYYPTFTFRYISAGGKSSTQFDTVMDIPMLERFVIYLSEQVKFKKSAAGQRRLMTPKLRQYIKERDNYTCQQCSNSTYEEPNLLLEIDHIIPVSRGGLTTEDNLQTLCWKCNRSKSNKIQEVY